MAQTYNLLVHNRPFKRKPEPAQVPQINNTISDFATSVTPQELAEMVGANGQTMVLAMMNGERKKENMASQQIVALDFDNSETRFDDNGNLIKDEKGKAKKFKTEGSNYSSVAEIFQNKFVQKNASFLYSTFSHTDDWHRFRLVFFLDKPMTNNKQVEMMYRWLMDKFPNADKANKDSSRLFFGGTEYIEINFDNVLDTSQVTFKKEEVKKETPAIAKKVAPIKHEEAVEAFDRYLDEDKENLQDYEHALSAIWVIARAALLGEISYPDAYLFSEKLALGNEEWAKNNQVKLKEALKTPLHEFHTNYTFSQKFMGKNNVATLDKSDIIATSKYLVERLDIKLFNNNLYFKDGNHWLSDNNKLLRAIDQYIELKHSQDNELMNQFMKRAELIEEEYFPIQLKNNFHIEGERVLEGSVDTFTPYYLDVEHEPAAHDADVDNFLDFLTCDRKDLRTVVEDMMGHILMSKGFPHKVFFFIGEKGANGKSTFLEMLNSFVGDLGTNISLENFNDPTSVVELEGNLVNIGDDIDANYLESSSNFKILASGNTLTVRPIYATPYRMKNKATLIFTANDMPTFKDKSGGIARRLIIIPCDNVVKEADFSIDEKLSTEGAKQYLLNLALAGLTRIKNNGGQISTSETIDANVKSYILESDSILAFEDEVGIDPNVPDNGIYRDYKDFCGGIGVKPFSKTS
ncbi:phage/plasmid primase, P4 family [Aerococcus sp. 1KP-2016]|uniref:DNA primase family protein n=1 Tax=Aerococcus sp. 1KP-2016 TaxID=1981982 RepID=UPI000B99C172|nr:phage/plasmid primase, P4 family [Aerococcus sp. 1KP-2016]OYQ68289.1 hypothetical protein B9P78_00325 [Aerococcus sp. 1KP-2016]